MNEYALITGASRGIGREIASLLAEKGYHLLLTARSETELREFSESLEKQYSIKAFYFVADLSNKTTVTDLVQWCTQQTNTLSILVNNAGYGLFGQFSDLSLQEQLDMLNLNISSVVELTHRLLPLLSTQKQAYILNIASTAAYQAVPSLAVYSATKSFILSFSRAIRYELKNTPISVSCLCPGPTETGFASRAGLDDFADLAAKFNMSPKKVAEAGLNGLFHKKAEIIPGFTNRISAFGTRLLPKALIEKIAAGLYQK